MRSEVEIISLFLSLLAFVCMSLEARALIAH